MTPWFVNWCAFAQITGRYSSIFHGQHSTQCKNNICVEIVSHLSFWNYTTTTRHIWTNLGGPFSVSQRKNQHQHRDLRLLQLNDLHVQAKPCVKRVVCVNFFNVWKTSIINRSAKISKTCFEINRRLIFGTCCNSSAFLPWIWVAHHKLL